MAWDVCRRRFLLPTPCHGEGHFRRIVEHTFASLRAFGIPLVITHGRYQLYRRFGFEVFTHHCGIFTTPEQIERELGGQAPEGAEQLLVVDEGKYTQDNLFLVTDVRATTFAESSSALQAAAALARRRGGLRGGQARSSASEVAFVGAGPACDRVSICWASQRHSQHAAPG
jgi:hypothetical protein